MVDNLEIFGYNETYFTKKWIVIWKNLVLK